jgi:hypothetical protein
VPLRHINHVAAQRFHIFSTGKIGNSGVIAVRLFAPIAATDKLALQRYSPRRYQGVDARLRGLMP